LKTLKIVSRKSPLARIQALLVAEKLTHSFPDLKIEHIYKKTLGDEDLNTPLNKMPDIGVFTNDIRNDLINKVADIAVHSWKDLPVDLEEGTEIVGTLDRADMRDMIFLKKESIGKKDLTILSSSPRRERNLSSFLPSALPFKAQIKFKDVRGNIHTRLTKLIEGSEDGLVVAKAAIDRFMNNISEEFESDRKSILAMQTKLNWMVLPLSQNPCAAAQGALAIEAREEDEVVKEIIANISNNEIFDSVEIERTILKSYGGGCHQKIGVSHEILETGKLLTVKGETEDGEDLSERSFNNNKEDYFHSVNDSNYFPRNKGEQRFFERKPSLDSLEALKKIKNKGIYVSRSNAIESSNLLDDSNIVWTSGVDTWKSLAQKGYWVNGTSDSLGENNSPEESLFEEISWLKVTHKDNLDKDKEVLVSYELNPLDVSERLLECDYFYWMSASSFGLAIEKYPELKDRNHACGLGQTFKFIEKVAPQVTPFLDFDSWLEAVRNKIK
jgi:hydroxymethylbilane synthase